MPDKTDNSRNLACKPQQPTYIQDVVNYDYPCIPKATVFILRMSHTHKN